MECAALTALYELVEFKVAIRFSHAVTAKEFYRTDGEEIFAVEHRLHRIRSADFDSLHQYCQKVQELLVCERILKDWVFRGIRMNNDVLLSRFDSAKVQLLRE